MTKILSDEELEFHADRLADIISNGVEIRPHEVHLVANEIENYFREYMEMGLGKSEKKNMSDLEGKIRFSAARFRELAKMAIEEGEANGGLLHMEFGRGEARAFRLAASQTDSLLTDDYADFLEAEEKKCVLETLLEKVRVEIAEDNLDEHRVDSYTAGRVGALGMVREWIEDAVRVTAEKVHKRDWVENPVNGRDE